MIGAIPTRRLLWGGIAGPVLFVAIFLVEGATRPGYDPVRHFVSLLSLGDGGWVQVANFLVSGTLIAAFGVGLERRRAADRGSRWTPRLIVVAGVALVASGVFSGDPALGYPPGAPSGMPTDASWHAGLHYVGSLVFFLGLPAAMILVARQAGRSGDRLRAAYALGSGLVMVAFWMAPFALTAAGASQVAGLLQRVAVLGGFQWLVVAAFVELGATVQLPARAEA